MFRQTSVILIIIILNFLLITNTQHLPLCESLNDIESNENNKNNFAIKSRRIRALCNAIYSTQIKSEPDDLESIPDFDLTQITSDNDANQILKRFRRSRSGGSSSGGGSSGGSRFSSSFSRSSSSSGSRSSSSGSSSSSRGSSGLFSRSGSSSSSSGSSSGSSGSRFFSRSSGSSSSSGSGSSSGSSGSRFFSRSSGSSSSSGSGSSPSSSGSRFFSRSSGSSSSSSGSRIFSRSGGSSSSNTGTQHRVRETVRTMFRHSPAAKPSGIPSASGGLSGTGGSKPSLKDKFQKITHGGGSGGGSSSGSFGSGGSRFSSGIGGNGFGTGGSSGSGGNVWVRAGKKFLPAAARYGKRYYQRRKYNKGMYAGIGAGTGYYAGSHMGSHHGHYYPHESYHYPPSADIPPEKIDGRTPTVFYCIQEDLNATLVNKTLNAEGFGVCNVSGKLVTCPIEIECQMDEADTCCEDEQGTPYCCGGPIPVEYDAQYGGFADDTYDAAESINKILNIITAMSVLLASICFTMWHRQGQ